MTAVTGVMFHCDHSGCGVTAYIRYVGEHLARAELNRSHGWRYTPVRVGSGLVRRDYCPEHASEGTHPWPREF